MLCLSMVAGGSIYLDLGDGRVVEARVLEVVGPDKIRLGFEADQSVKVYRDRICPQDVLDRVGCPKVSP